MSSLDKFLPASEPARSEVLAQLKKTHHVPRHLVKAIARSGLGQRFAVQSEAVQQVVQEAPSPRASSPDGPAPLQAL